MIYYDYDVKLIFKKKWQFLIRSYLPHGFQEIGKCKASFGVSFSELRGKTVLLQQAIANAIGLVLYSTGMPKKGLGSCWWPVAQHVWSATAI